MNKLILHTILALSLIGAASVPASADIYKFTDNAGVIHFSNVPEKQDIQKVVRESCPAPEKIPPAKDYQTKAEKCDKTERASFVPACDGEVPFSDIINAKCTKYGVDPALVKSIIKAESNFNPKAVSNKGARGLMQLMPATASDMGVSNSFDPEQNIDGGVKYLKFLLDNFGGDVELSVAAYNCGQGKVIRCGNAVPNIAETQNYVKKVLRLSKNPVTGDIYSKPIYKIELKDGSILFTDTPIAGARISLAE
jgi:hypothetical protein